MCFHRRLSAFIGGYLFFSEAGTVAGSELRLSCPQAA
jgi:hypothetical protein